MQRWGNSYNLSEKADSWLSCLGCRGFMFLQWSDVLLFVYLFVLCVLIHLLLSNNMACCHEGYLCYEKWAIIVCSWFNAVNECRQKCKWWKLSGLGFNQYKNYRQITSFACLTRVSLFGVFSQGAKMCRFFMKFSALFGTPKQTMCHNSKNTQPISTKFQGLLNLYERHAVDTFWKHFIDFWFCVFWNFSFVSIPDVVRRHQLNSSYSTVLL